MLKQQIEILDQSFYYFSKNLFNNKLTEENTIITIQSKGKLNCYGWCTVEPIWHKGIESDKSNESNKEQYYEINISAEYMNRSFYNTIETLLHEMVHLNNILDGIDDCNKKQFHNEKFKESAERIGLKVEKIKRYGWANTTLGNELREMVDKFIHDNKIATCCFNIARKDKEVRKVIKNNKKIKMVCNGCKNIVSCDDEISIICKDCGIEFVKK